MIPTTMGASIMAMLLKKVRVFLDMWLISLGRKYVLPT